MTTAMLAVLGDVAAERRRQDDKWGEQNHPDGTGADKRPEGSLYFKFLADYFRAECDAAAADGTITWRHILLEEFFEAMAEDDPLKLREELVQTAAVAVRWCEAIDRRLS